MSREENAEDYNDVVLRLTGGTRVINCRDNLQWIIQHYTGKRWRNRHFCRERASLLRLLGAALDGHNRETIKSLPEYHP